MDPMVAVLLFLLIEVVVLTAGLFLLSGGNFGRIAAACGAFSQALRTGAPVPKTAAPPVEVKKAPPKPSGAPLRLLSLLQREGRLLDFLLEDIQAYPDAQIGAAVRDIHRQCQAALKEHLVLEPVLAQAEGANVEIPTTFDPASVRLTGNVTGQPPFRGTLQHHGWRVKEIKLAAPPEGQDEFIVMPAEVELP